MSKFNQLPLGVLKGDDGAGVVANDIERRVERLLLGHEFAMGFGEMPIARRRLPPFDDPQQPDQTGRAELGKKLEEIG